MGLLSVPRSDGEEAGLWGFLPVADLVRWKSGGCRKAATASEPPELEKPLEVGAGGHEAECIPPAPGTSQEGARSPQPTPGRIFLLASGSCCPTAIGAHHPLPVPPRVCIHLETQRQEIK